MLLLDTVESQGDSGNVKRYVDEKNLSGNTALHLAVSKVNCVNNFGETPLHKAAAYNASDVIDFLLKNGANLESHDNSHFTPLLIAVAEGHVDAIKTLLKYKANIDVLDNMDRSVIFWASQENHKKSLLTLLKQEYSADLVNRCDHYDNSPLHIAALKGFLEVSEILLNCGAEIERKNEHEQTPLHLAAKNGHVDTVQLLIQKSKTIVNAEDENANTPLHHAAMSGHYSMVSVLLHAGANIEAKNCYLWTALDCAASRGWKRCCQILLNSGAYVDTVDKSKATPLHIAARDGHRGVVKLLLKYGANIAQCDKNGKNCLDLAIDKEVALEILSDLRWEAVLRNETSQNKFGIHETPLRRLIHHMPDVAEHVLDQCIVTNHYPEDHRLDESDKSSESSSSALTGSNIYDDCGFIKKKAMPYVKDREILKYNHPLMLMVTYGRENLLSHPLCETLPPCPTIHDEPIDPNCCAITNNTCPPYIGKCDINTEQVFPRLCRNFIYVLAVLHLLKEIYQIHQNGRRYISIENALEWACYVSALLFVADLTECSSQTGIREVWQWELGALSIFCAWMVLLMFISKFPFLGIYVIMFFQILSTFINFSFVFFLFVVAFALGFYALLQNQNPFENPGEAIVKTGVMMIGEIEFDAIFNDPNNKVYFSGPTYALFIIFLLIMAVIIMNLLIGLAVDDIKGVQEKAELQRLAMKVELVLTVERILPVVVLRKCIYKYRHILPNAWKSYPWYMKICRVKQDLTPKLSKTALEIVDEKQAKISKQMKELQESIFQMQKDLKHIIDDIKKKD
ncbi:transient receptor potential cation channel subfamily A member 1 homolog [Caerostris extrusa]|uniref:Transient receptor potential cation channel subfamily A member 1 homolog n=1 Tax=Caerostris extrusa TaxID=172846 RepID=A0AAV4Y7J9_CAEEX|nr:transient receptor potential cation channel subfamily A member 1 homolog [Caerostris extrusa]